MGVQTKFRLMLTAARKQEMPEDLSPMTCEARFIPVQTSGGMGRGMYFVIRVKYDFNQQFQQYTEVRRSTRLQLMNAYKR